jgi:hypothetical protein
VLQVRFAVTASVAYGIAISWHECFVLPGLLQTPEYARTVP